MPLMAPDVVDRAEPLTRFALTRDPPSPSRGEGRRSRNPRARGVGVVIIERRAAIGEECGGHAGSVAPDRHFVQRSVFIGGIGWGYTLV